jgi:hypothetical protein
VFVGLIGLLDRLLPTARARPGELQ